MNEWFGEGTTHITMRCGSNDDLRAEQKGHGIGLITRIIRRIKVNKNNKKNQAERI
jgi:hypothetical protein